MINLFILIFFTIFIILITLLYKKYTRIKYIVDKELNKKYTKIKEAINKNNVQIKQLKKDINYSNIN